MRSFRFLSLLALVATLHLQAMQLTLNVTHANCSYANGAIQVQLTGGVAPYTYLWDDGAAYAQRTNLVAGIYTLTVTDANLDQVVQQAEVLSVPYDFYTEQLFPYCVAGGQLWPVDPVPQEALGPWYFDGEQLQIAPGSGGNGGPGTVYAYYPSFTSYSYSITDGNGCSGTLNGTRGPQITNWPSLIVTSVEGSCTMQGTGKVHIQASGPTPDQSFAHLRFIDPLGIDEPYYGQVDDITYTADITGVMPGTYGIMWSLGMTLEALDTGLCDVDTLWITVPDLGPTCGDLVGSMWYDVDGDCVHDANEVGIPYSPLLIQPGNEVIHSGPNGTFATPLLNGNYTLAQLDPTLVPICPAIQPVAFTISTNTVTLSLADGSTQPLDLHATITTGVARPGFDVGVNAGVYNMSPQASGPVTITVTLDPLLTYLSAVPAPTTIAGNILTWQLPPFTSYEHLALSILTHLPSGVPLGTQLVSTAAASNTLPDPNAYNDSFTSYRVVQGSFDPNDKSVRTSTGLSSTDYLIDQDEYLDYTIRFQNTGTDTAFTVTVIDTLPPELDLLTYEQGAASHPFDVSFRAGGIVQWTFPNILLPDSTTNEFASHGQVSFRIRPVLPVIAGTTISNHADIIFDFNAAVRTNDAVLTATLSTGLSSSANAPCHLVRFGDQLMVYAFASTLPISTLHLLSLDGRSVQRIGSFTLDHSGRAIDISSLASGCYVITVEMKDGRSWQERFVR